MLCFSERLHLPIGHGDLDQLLLIVLMVACLSGSINVVSCMKEKDRGRREDARRILGIVLVKLIVLMMMIIICDRYHG